MCHKSGGKNNHLGIACIYFCAKIYPHVSAGNVVERKKKKAASEIGQLITQYLENCGS